MHTSARSSTSEGLAVSELVRRDYQVESVEQVKKLIAEKRAGRLVLVAPPGAGKSLIMRDVVRHVVDEGLTAGVLVHRRMLLRQTIETFDEDDIKFSVIAAGYEDMYQSDAKVFLCIIQTLVARTKSGKRFTSWRRPSPIPRRKSARDRQLCRCLLASSFPKI